MRLGPELFGGGIIRVDECDLLDSGPAQDSIMADERSDVTAARAKADGGIDNVGEKGDAVLKVAMDYLHNAR